METTTRIRRTDRHVYYSPPEAAPLRLPKIPEAVKDAAGSALYLFALFLVIRFALLVLA